MKRKHPAKSTTVKKLAMLEALKKTLGLVTHACKIVDIDRSTHYDWLRNDEDYKEKCDAVSELVLDYVESSLYKQINQGSAAATIFFLKTRGKNRGYHEEVPQIVAPKHEIILTYEKEKLNVDNNNT